MVCVFNGKMDIVFLGEVDGCLNVFDRCGIYYVGWVVLFRVVMLMFVF